MLFFCYSYTMQNIIFTDLDGTLLNHDTYTFDEAHEALSYVKSKKIPLIFTTSKTKKEVEQLQKEVGITDPFIVENGAALFIPSGYHGLKTDTMQSNGRYHVKVFGKPHSDILAFYKKYKARFGMQGFSDMSVEEVAALTQMDTARAAMSKERDFTEPFILDDPSRLPDIEAQALKYGIKVTKGGRFYHLIGLKQDKGVAVKQTIELYEASSENKIHTIGLGDSLNDLPMLSVVSTAIAIRQHTGTYLVSKEICLHKSSFPGSRGWNEMVLKYVS